MLVEGKDFLCADAGGVLICYGANPERQQLYQQFQKQLQSLNLDVPTDGNIGPSTTLAVIAVLQRLGQTVQPPQALWPIVQGSAVEAIKHTAALAPDIIGYATQVLQRYPEALWKATPPPPLAAPVAPSILTVKNGLIAAGGAVALGGAIFGAYKIHQRVAGRSDGRHFLPPDEDDGDSGSDGDD